MANITITKEKIVYEKSTMDTLDYVNNELIYATKRKFRKGLGYGYELDLFHHAGEQPSYNDDGIANKGYAGRIIITEEEYNSLPADSDGFSMNDNHPINHVYKIFLQTHHNRIITTE
jgi:hypothetical protein